ncbi:MAG TPA: glycosyltransferase [Saprospiraceae bacterium]|nr:glycosyltransferase [Saprospiraceae bacterium]
MLSVLIPLYNYDIRQLLSDLDARLRRSGIAYEILVLDDASLPEYAGMAAELRDLPGIRWLTAPVNAGRSASRNRLAREARYEHLLFLDCDVRLIRENFIDAYLEHIRNEPYDVLYGACLYPDNPPKDKALLLHWYYGSQVENPSLHDRLKHPFTRFHSVNFVVRKAVLAEIPFDERIRDYGHEDSLWAMDLKARGKAITHLDNPVLHEGLVSDKWFLRKTSHALKNLIRLERENRAPESALLNTYGLLKRLKMIPLAFRIYRKLERRIVRNLRSGQPAMRALSLYKLGLFIRFVKKA